VLFRLDPGFAMAVTIDGKRMTGAKVARVARANASGRFEKAGIEARAREAVGAARDYIDANWLNDQAPLMYAFNTGVGLFKEVRIPIANMAHYQDQTIRAHATGIGEPEQQDEADGNVSQNVFRGQNAGRRYCRLVKDRPCRAFKPEIIRK